ncbi:MAG TPA: ABC transporter substrate-binding protein [Candidatus Dormibacteraeota bacterium]|nr:ABC transporter substrate-binding protein [Candidatus Dormibacteraeota bacterium]
MKRARFNALVAGGAIAAAASSASRVLAAEGPVRIGVIGSLTGGASTYGVAEQDGIQLAADELNAKGGLLGRKIELVVRDDQADPSVATTAALELAQSQKVVAIFGPIVNTAALAVARMSDQLKVPILGTLGATTPVVYPQGTAGPPNPWVFRVLVSSPVQVAALVAYGASKGYKKWAIVYENDAYGIPTVNDLQAALSRAGGAIVAREAIAIDATDATAQALAVKAANPDVILIWTIQSPASKIVQALARAGAKTPIFSANAQVSPQFFQLAGSLANGIVSTALRSQYQSNARVDAFRNAYRSRFKIDPTLWSFCSYDAARLYFEAVDKARTDDPSAVRAQLEKTVYAGLTGRIVFTPKVHDGITAADVMIVRIENGKAVPA